MLLQVHHYEKRHRKCWTLYLPPYSPDLNPIEKKWSQAKSIRRRIGGNIEELLKEHDL